MNTLDVFLHENRVGTLERLPGAELRFTYDDAWVADAASSPLSISLPVRGEPFGNAECRPFFAGLLPEGGFLKAVARQFGVSAGNPFSLLAEIGGECAGAVSLVPPGVDLPLQNAPPPDWLSPERFARLLSELPRRPLLADFDDGDGIRFSLAGAQDKLPILWRNGRAGITRGRPPSSHILKVPMSEIEDMVANEAFCMALAAEAGLSTAKTMPLAVGDHEGLMVQRYDRVADPEGAGVRRIHQEDLCQALGIPSDDKYQADGGPGVAACGQLIWAHSAAPAPDVFAFLDALFFNLLIGNADGHSKNYSLLLDGGEAPRLAPLYDLLSTRAYGRRFSRKMAMKYGGEYRPDRIRGRHLDRLADDVELAPGGVRRRADEVIERVLAAAPAARGGLPARWQGVAIVDRIEGLVADMVKRLRRAAAEPA
jgi:serine/threonine-protein kinase HipA